MEQFILADMQRKLLEDEQQVLTVTGADERLARLDALVRAAEQKAIAWEQMGGLNPHVNVLRGPKWKVFLKRLIRKLTWFLICPLVEQQNYFNALANGMANELRDSIWILKELVQEQRQSLAKFEETRQSLAELEKAQRRFLTDLAGLTESQKWLRDAYMEELEKMRVELENLREKLPVAKEDGVDYIDYGTFEDKFRGSQKEIRTRIQRYLEYFKPGERVVDLGCGRGEWLELLVEKGIDASGVDITEKFVLICQRKGLNVIHKDMFCYLESIPDRSLDGITAIQVIEHIDSAALARLIQLSYRKLKLGGRIILETPNPMSVSTLTNNFYIDPTHIRPVHPALLDYLLKAGNFTSIIMDYPKYAWVTGGCIPPLEGESQNIKQFNRQIEHLNNFLYGAVEYAAIATK